MCMKVEFIYKKDEQSPSLSYQNASSYCEIIQSHLPKELYISLKEKIEFWKTHSQYLSSNQNIPFYSSMDL